MRLPSLLPREDRFYGLLKSSAANLRDISKKLVELMGDYTNITEKVAHIKYLEEVGDHIIHEIMRNLHRTFVTPMDREDIAQLGERLDDVVDAIEEGVRNMVEYHIEKPTARAVELATIIEKQAVVLEEAIAKLRFHGARLKEILPDAVELNRLENEADQVMSRAVGELFSSYSSPVDIIKWREIYGHLEEATDRSEDAANVLEGIVLKRV